MKKLTPKKYKYKAFFSLKRKIIYCYIDEDKIPRMPADAKLIVETNRIKEFRKKIEPYWVISQS